MSNGQGSSLLDVVGGLPACLPEDVVALRRARAKMPTRDQAARLRAALPEPSHENLARRPIMDGDPFEL